MNIKKNDIADELLRDIENALTQAKEAEEKLRELLENEQTGHWIPYDERFPWRKDYKCSNCGNYLNFESFYAGRGDSYFCPKCGAKMKGVTT